MRGSGATVSTASVLVRCTVVAERRWRRADSVAGSAWPFGGGMHCFGARRCCLLQKHVEKQRADAGRKAPL